VITTRRRRTGGVAWLAALTMTVLAVSPLLAIFHQISARHAVCEHGELVESGDSGFSAEARADLDAQTAARDRQSAPASEIRPDSDVALHSHSHCSVGTLAKHNVGLLSCTQVVAALSEVRVGAPHPGEFAYVHNILFSAPKTSPPHAAS
jgi:ABC-type glutathione transport system ATPase component